MAHNLDSLNEPDRWLDALIDYIESVHDDDLRVWAVEGLAGAVGVPTLVGDPDDDVRNVLRLAEGLAAVIWLAGQDPEERRSVLVAADKALEVVEAEVAALRRRVARQWALSGPPA